MTHNMNRAGIRNWKPRWWQRILWWLFLPVPASRQDKRMMIDWQYFPKNDKGMKTGYGYRCQPFDGLMSIMMWDVIDGSFFKAFDEIAAQHCASDKPNAL